MTLSDDSKERVEAQVRRMIADLRLKPTQEKEDLMGVEILALPPEEREYVTAVLLRIVAEERSGPGR